MNEIIFFPARITSFYIYSCLVKELSNFYRTYSDKSICPRFSFERVEYIDPTALPIIISIGSVLSKWHSKSIPLELNYNPKILYYLYHTNFFKIVGDENYEFSEGLNIFSFDKSFIGGFDDYIKKHYEDVHKTTMYHPVMNYYEISDISKQLEYRSKVFENIRYQNAPKEFRELFPEFNQIFVDKKEALLTRNGSVSTEVANQILDIFSELISNAILYSCSESFITWARNKYKTIISIADAGIGLDESLKRKSDYKYNIQAYLDERKYFNRSLIDYIIIFETLNYSQLQKRKNLWSLKNLIVNNNGTFRIHYNSTQIIFTSNRCKGCEKSAMECSICLLDNFRKEKEISPLRLFENNFKGVHIEAEISNKWENQ